MAKKVVTLGEIMLRLSTPDYKRFVQADSFDATYGGGEANVSVALCNYGLNGVFVSKVPDKAIRQSAGTFFLKPATSHEVEVTGISCSFHPLFVDARSFKAGICYF